MKNFEKGKITICRHGIIGEDYITLTINDKNSSLVVIEVKIPLDEFARALTNLSYCKCTYKAKVKEGVNFGKKKIVQEVLFDNPDKWDKKKSTEAVEKHFKENYGGTDWEIWCDGTSRRQDDKLYHYTIYRYEEIKEGEDTNDYDYD